MSISEIFNSVINYPIPWDEVKLFIIGLLGVAAFAFIVYCISALLLVCGVGVTSLFNDWKKRKRIAAIDAEKDRWNNVGGYLVKTDKPVSFEEFKQLKKRELDRKTKQ